jgi:hypothetical protein
VFIKHNGDIYASLTKSSSTNDLLIKSGTTDAMEFTGAAVEAKGNLTVAGQTLLADGSATSPAIARSGGSGVTRAGIHFTGDVDGGGKGAIIFSADGQAQIAFADGFFKPVDPTDQQINMGGSSKKFADGFFSGTMQVGDLKIDNVVVSATPTELNFMDGDATISTGITLAADDGVVVNDGGSMLQAEVSDFATYVSDNITNNAIDGTKIQLGSDAEGDIMYYNGTDYVRLARGSNGQVLRLSGGVPIWDAPRPEAPGTPNSSSDRRFKKNISTVSGALQKLSKLNPVNYDWRQDEFEHKGFGDKKQWGFIAQEIKDILPELVGKDDEDFLTLNYQGFVPLLTKAVQEQQEEIDSQQKEIDALKSQLQMIMDMLDNDMSDKTDNKKDNDNKKPVKLSMATQK